MPKPSPLLAAAVLVLGSGLVAACSSDGESGGSGPASSTTAPAGPAPASQVQVVVDLRAETSTAAPVDGMNAVAISPDGTEILTLGKTTEGTLDLRSFPYEPGRTTSPSEGRVVMRIDHPYVHSGGSIVFDEDGAALVSLGAVPFDGEPGGPQNPDGVVVKIPPKFLASEGPTFTPTRDDLVARGLRNPWRMTRDRSTGDLWIGDVGDGTAEEINTVPADQQAGDPLNFGFPYREGDTTTFEPIPDGLDLTAPAWFHGRGEEDGNSIIGGFVYRGDEIAELKGRYVFTDFTDRSIRSMEPGGSRTDSQVSATVVDPPTGFAEDPDGELYLLTAPGDVFRLGATTEPDAEADGPALALELFSFVRRSPQDRTGPEATSFAFEADGKAIVAADRSGLVTRVELAATDEPKVCGFDIDQLPVVGHLTGEDLEKGVKASLTAYEEYGPSFPAWLQDEVEVATAFFEEAEALGTSEGWDADEIVDLMKLAALERGPSADAAHAEQVLFNYIGETC